MYFFVYFDAMLVEKSYIYKCN